MQETSFVNWRREVDKVLADRLLGMTGDCLPDVDYWGHKSTSERNVCQKHLGDAWNGPATEAHPIDVGQKP